MTAFFKPLCKLSRRRRFTGTLQTNKHEHRRRLGSKVDANVCTAEHLNQFVADNLDDLLAGSQALHDLLTESLRLDGIGKLLHNLKVDIRFEQRHPDFFQCLVKVLFGKPALATEILKNAL